MKWFKHISDSLDDPFIVELLDEFGAEAYLVFFGIIEIYSREFSPENSWKLDVTLQFFHRKLHTSPSKLKKILSKITKWNVEYKDNRVIIFIPKFKELLDNWTVRKIQKEDELLRSKDVETTQPIRIKKKKENKEEDNRGIFQIPLLQEISDYCQQRKNKVNPQLFIDHYTANGWMVGKNKMKDWKAAIRTWETREVGNSKKQPTPQAQTSPYVICPKCKADVLNSDFMEIDGKNYCVKCPEVKKYQEESYKKISGLVKGIGREM